MTRADAPSFEVRRVYDAGSSRRGYRVLVDRLWPRGIAKGDLELDEWCKDVAPSTELRRWYGHVPARFEEFARRYEAELARPPGAAAVEHLVTIAARRPVTLLTATRDVEHSGAEVLRRHLLAATAAG
jgi:uncharacterized protein YeaO (DUF488 family)